MFDKTGTLTEDHLNIAGFLPIDAHSNHQQSEDSIFENNNVFTFSDYVESVKDLSKKNFEYYKNKIKDPMCKNKTEELMQLYIECLACCQGITRVKGKLIGDPIDVEMFEGTGWELIEEVEDTQNYDPRIPTYVRPKEEKSLTEKLQGKNRNENSEEIINLTKDHYELGIVRRFDFSSKLQRMSTLAKNIYQDNFVCYCKGSPEKIKELCQSSTIPANFNEQLNNYTMRGFRVLAMGAKIIKMDYSQAMEIARSSCEKDLIFLGLLIVQNKLKDATNRTLQTLTRDAHIRVRMATGDNIMTAVCVGRKSNLIEPNSIVYSCEIEDIESEYEKEQKNDNLIRRNSLNLYDNNIQIQKEKEIERNKKRLVWNTIESFQNEDENSGLDSDLKNPKKAFDVAKRLSYINDINALS